ncbi:MAG: hypothetical protein FJX46_05390 [Alphaproteobacteria bacterium]|nr:hypothetical protein [Alphaproteobacteria bacterium]
MRLSIRALLGVVPMPVAGMAAAQERRLALIVGDDAYRTLPRLADAAGEVAASLFVPSRGRTTLGGTLPNLTYSGISCGDPLTFKRRPRPDSSV